MTGHVVGGRPVGVVFEGARQFALQVRFPPEVRDDEAAKGKATVKNPG